MCCISKWNNQNTWNKVLNQNNWKSALVECLILKVKALVWRLHVHYVEPKRLIELSMPCRMCTLSKHTLRKVVLVEHLNCVNRAFIERCHVHNSETQFWWFQSWIVCIWDEMHIIQGRIHSSWSSQNLYSKNNNQRTYSASSWALFRNKYWSFGKLFNISRWNSSETTLKSLNAHTEARSWTKITEKALLLSAWFPRWKHWFDAFKQSFHWALSFAYF